MRLIVFAPKPFEIKPLCPNDICALYGISQHILNKWLSDMEDLGEPIANMYNIAQVTKIIQRYGVPGHFIKLISDDERDNTEQFETIRKAA